MNQALWFDITVAVATIFAGPLTFFRGARRWGLGIGIFGVVAAAFGLLIVLGIATPPTAPVAPAATHSYVFTWGVVLD